MYAVLVTPAGGSQAHLQNTGPWTAVFTVENTGDFWDLYLLTCSTTGGMSCVSVQPDELSLNPDQSAQVTVTYNVGTSSGDVKLTATGQAFATGWYTVTTNPDITFIVPVLTSGSRSVVRNRQPIVRAFLTAKGSPLDTTKTVLTWRTSTDTITKFQADSLAMARHNRALLEWEVDSARWLAIGDSALITIKACAQNALCTTVTRWAVLPNDSKPVLGFAGRPLESLGRGFGAPFGPGLAVNGAEVETGFGIPSYTSLGTARRAGLVYSTRTSYPRALVPVDLELTWPVGTPDQIKLILLEGSTKLDSLVLTSPTCATGSARRCRAVLQGDFSASSFSTPTRKWLTVEARITSGAVTHIAADSTEVVIVDRRATPYGSGWWPSAYLQLVAAGSDRLLVGPAGTAAIYRGVGDSVYLPPPGDFTALVKVGTSRELRPRGSTAKLVFDANGRLFKSLDPNGNRDSIAFSGSSDQITAFVDPVGKTITFTYASGKLSTITDPGSRQSKVTINGTTNQLTYDSIASPPTRSNRTTFVYQTYPGTNTVVLTKTIGVILDTTIVTYDSTFKRRPTQVRLAQVKDENGNTVNPVIAYTAYERRGYGALVSLDSVYVEMKDPRNNWTRSLLNRWGQARKTWDALGLLGRSEYTAEGFVRWSEGKVADSSRVYRAYDAARRLIKTYIKRSATDILRLDSLVYDANHRPIQRLDSRGKVWKTYYDANGNVIATVEPNAVTPDSTSYWYRSDGLLDSLRLPTATRSRRFTYDATFKNLYRAFDENNTKVLERFYDTGGRPYQTYSKVRVAVTSAATSSQWRLVEPFFNAANQLDSTVLSRTDNCTDPCDNYDFLPWPGDTFHVQRVGHRYDRAGRDSIRLNDRGMGTGKGVRYQYDRLSRLMARYPWAPDSTGVRDSFFYDVAGNLKKTITRRGDVITVNYDSRNRDTLSVIGGVDTLRRAFGGPLDQLTRQWYQRYTDSIGNVNPAVAWVYDQRGRLKSDTTYTGTTARATSYTYDT
ncbi:MAG: hypothetical protein ACREMF_06925, partial [Gemmatimonadales bacterium]